MIYSYGALGCGRLYKMAAHVISRSIEGRRTFRILYVSQEGIKSVYVTPLDTPEYLIMKINRAGFKKKDEK